MATKGNFSFTIRPRAAAKGEIEQVVTQTMIDLCEGTVAEAKPRSPHDTGHNKRNIWWGDPTTGKPNRPGPNGELAVFTTSGYGGYLEVGTGKMPGRPYIVPSAESVAKQMGAK